MVFIFPSIILIIYFVIKYNATSIYHFAESSFMRLERKTRFSFQYPANFNPKVKNKKKKKKKKLPSVLIAAANLYIQT